MPNILICMLAALQLLGSALPSAPVPARLRSGEWLRFHVVAHDDTPDMQALKLTVRDAVQACYREQRSPAASSMEAEAERLLPHLAAAAHEAARAAGFSGAVSVSLGVEAFGDRMLKNVPVPAGEYPALMIRLGSAQGQNWWGLLDPDMSLQLAAVPGTQEGSGIIWDWSLEALLRALFRWPLAEGA